MVPEVVVADIDLNTPEIDVGDMGANLIQEVPVMGDDDHRVLEAEQELSQPIDGLDVQVIGGLVQQEDVRVAEQGLGQQHPDLVGVLQLLHLLLAQILGDAEAGEQHRGITLRIIAVHLAEFDLQVAHPDAVGLGQFRLGVEGLALDHHLVEAGMAHDHGVDHRLFVKGEVVLTEHGNALAGAGGDVTMIRLLFPGQDLEEGGLACAVGADQAVAVARGELDVDVFENYSLAIGKRDINGSDHGKIPYDGRAPLALLEIFRAAMTGGA